MAQCVIARGIPQHKRTAGRNSSLCEKTSKKSKKKSISVVVYVENIKKSKKINMKKSTKINTNRRNSSLFEISKIIVNNSLRVLKCEIFFKKTYRTIKKQHK